MNIEILNTVNLDGTTVTYQSISNSGGGGGNSGGGGSTPKWTGHADAEGLKAIGWTDEDIAYYQATGVNWNEEDDEYHKVTDDNKALYGVLTASNIVFYKSRIVYLPKIDMSSNTHMSGIFASCYSLIAIPMLDTSNVTSLYNAFSNCYSLTSIPMLNTSKVNNMTYTFQKCYSLKSIPMLDTSGVKSMDETFSDCYSLTSIPQLDTSNVTSMNKIFYYCYSLTSIPMLDTSNVTNNSDMFYYCNSIIHANLKNVKVSYDLKKATLLTKDSLLYFINNEAATSAITLTLANYAYNKWANDPDVVAALANHPKISLASA